MYGNPMMQQPMYAAPQNYPYGQPMGFGNYGMNAGMVNQPMISLLYAKYHADYQYTAVHLPVMHPLPN